MNPADLLDRIHEHGGHAELSGQYVRLRASKPLPPDLMAEIRLNKVDLLAYLAGKETEGETKAGLKVFEYRLTDDPGQWLFLLADCSLAEARRSLRDRFGAARVLAVRKRPA